MKKKVLMFVPTFPVLTETFIERDVAALASSDKIDIKVIAIKQGCEFRSKKAENVTSYERLDFFTFLSSFGYVVSRPLNIIKAFHTLGVTHFYQFFKALGYAKIFSRYSPDIIYAQFLSSPSTIAMGAAIILGKPFAISAHARDVLEYPDLVKQKVKYAKFIAFCNKNALEKAKKLAGNVAYDNLKLIYHGINEEELHPINITIQKPSQNFIFSVGRLTEKKGIQYLIGASEILRDRGIEHLIYVAGDGPLFAHLEAEIKKLNLEPNIILLGETPFSEIVQLLNLADVYVQPAIDARSGDSDGVPNTLVEATLLKKPIVTTHAGSISDFLDESSAVIVEQRHATGLAEGIYRLLEDRDLGKRLAENAFTKAKEVFSTEKNLHEIEDLLLK